MLKRKTIIIAVFIFMSLIVSGCENEKDIIGYDFKIYFWNAGKADAMLISKNNKYILIDTGEENLSDDILNYFKENNIKKLDYLIITHFDKDHVGSASNIINEIEIGEVLQSNYPKESEYYTNYVNSLLNKKITPITVKGNYELTLEDLKIIINGPEIIYDKNESNNSSLIVSIFHKNNKFLFMGDSENARIKGYVKDNNENYDFIKMPYHGRYLKRLDDLLEIVKPKYAVMTCSLNEGCEINTLKLLKDYNVNYYMTKNGDITVLSNGEDIIINQ